jgi:uncharacterized glyoxalase superfamily protein PhnB
MSDVVAAERPGAKAQPAVLGGVVPYLSVEGAVRAAELYARAFGAVEVARQPVDAEGRTMHLHMYLDGGSLMLSDFYPEYGHPPKPVQGVTLHLFPEDIDAAFARAVEAGCEVLQPVQTMFWGDRYGQTRDPFGVTWAMVATAN